MSPPRLRVARKGFECLARVAAILGRDSAKIFDISVKRF